MNIRQLSEYPVPWNSSVCRYPGGKEENYFIQYCNILQIYTSYEQQYVIKSYVVFFPWPPHLVLFRVRVCLFPPFKSTPYLRLAKKFEPPFRGLFTGFSCLGDPPKSGTLLNEFFITNATKITKDIPRQSYSEEARESNVNDCSQFSLHPVSLEFVIKEIDHLCQDKATGEDGISCKILKLSKHVIAQSLIPPLHQRYVHAVLATSKKNGHDAVGTATAY